MPAPNNHNKTQTNGFCPKIEHSEQFDKCFGCKYHQSASHNKWLRFVTSDCVISELKTFQIKLVFSYILVKRLKTMHSLLARIKRVLATFKIINK